MEINFNLISTAFYQQVQPQMGRLGRHIVEVLNAASKLVASHPFAGLITANIILSEASIRIARIIGEFLNMYAPYEVANKRQKDIIFLSFMTGLVVGAIAGNYVFITTLNLPLFVGSGIALGTISLFIWTRCAYT